MFLWILWLSQETTPSAKLFGRPSGVGGVGGLRELGRASPEARVKIVNSCPLNWTLDDTWNILEHLGTSWNILDLSVAVAVAHGSGYPAGPHISGLKIGDVDGCCEP